MNITWYRNVGLLGGKVTMLGVRSSIATCC